MHGELDAYTPDDPHHVGDQYELPCGFLITAGLRVFFESPTDYD